MTVRLSWVVGGPTEPRGPNGPKAFIEFLFIFEYYFEAFDVVTLQLFLCTLVWIDALANKTNFTPCWWLAGPQ